MPHASKLFVNEYRNMVLMMMIYITHRLNITTPISNTQVNGN
jgi:hypothetical protein